jgi:hypothetical protein
MSEEGAYEKIGLPVKLDRPFEQKETGTNFMCLGRLVDSPKIVHTSNGKLVAEFVVAYRSSPKYPAVFLQFVCFDVDVVEYLAENFGKGDRIQVLRSTPFARISGKQEIRRDTNTRDKMLKFVVFDIAQKEWVEYVRR